MIISFNSSCNYLSWKATVPSHKIYALPHDYILKSFLKRNYFIFVPDRGLEKALYKLKVIEILKQ